MKQSISYRLSQKPLGTLVDISLKLAKCPRNTDSRIAVLERLNSMFGFYSPTAQCAIFQGYIKRKLSNKTSASFACDKILDF